MVENILYHALCLVMLLLLFIDYLGKEKKLTGSLETVYYMTALIVVSDCVWDTCSFYGATTNAFFAYSINIVYFLAEILAVYAWMRFALRKLNSDLFFNKKYLGLLTIPVILISILTLISPFTGYVFRIENGEYIRGNLFFIDTIAKLAYLSLTSGYAYYCYRKESRKYLRNQYGLLAIYAIPIVIGGIIQALTYADLNCVAPVIGLAIIYKNGLTNEAKENEDLVDAIAKAYAAVFIVNTDTHKVRTIHAADCYKTIEELAKTNLYEDCVANRVHSVIVPEDKLIVEQSFAISNILQQLENKNAYTLVYRVQGKNQFIYNKATFIKAFSDEDRNDIFIGIEKVEARQILLQKKESLEKEYENLERIKESLTTVVANIIEARDIDSGEHVLRVKNYTQYLCNQIMADYPKYGLNPAIIRYITSGSALHDIGKIMIPDSILLKPGALTEEEFEVMKTHCEKGCIILNRLPNDLDKEYVQYARDICRWHHEKYDGKGYPDGLKGNQIPISAQIVSIADCFDALTSKRVYKDAISKQEAYELIMGGGCGVFNPDLLNCFVKVYQQYLKD